MLPRRQRLKSPVRETTSSNSHPTLSYRARGNNLPYSRLLVVTSKKLGGAVVRNRARRLINAVFLEISCKMAKNCDIVFYPRLELVTMKANQVKLEMLSLMKKLLK